MKRYKGAFKICAVILSVAVGMMGVLSLDMPTVFGRLAAFSVMAVTPEGLFGAFSKEETEAEKQPMVETVVGEVIMGSSDNEKTSDCVAVEQVTLGSIIKKTLTPYTANTKSNGVYISNQSGASLDIYKDITNPLEFSVEKSNEPQILIYHTHATESYMTDESQYYTDFDEPRSEDTELNIVKIGEIISTRLNEAGYTALHDKTLHDGPSYSGSYSRSAETVKSYLQQYPSIKIVIDIHRDSISSGKSDKVAPVIEVDSKEAAQVMIVMGSETGTIEDHPSWRENVRLATKLQFVLENMYPQLARAMLLKSSKYNQNLSTGSILIEVGSDANTLEQAKYSAELLSKALIVLLDSQ